MSVSFSQPAYILALFFLFSGLAFSDCSSDADANHEQLTDSQKWTSAKGSTWDELTKTFNPQSLGANWEKQILSRAEKQNQHSVLLKKVNSTYFIGNSLIEWINEVRWRSRASLRWYYEGWLSFRRSQLLDSIPLCVASDKSIKKVVICLWNNDYNEDRSWEECADSVINNIITLASKFQSKQVYVLWLRVVQSDPDQTKFAYKVNVALKEASLGYGYIYIDISDSEWFDQPWIHPSWLWYVYLWDYIFSKIE